MDVVQYERTAFDMSRTKANWRRGFPPEADPLFCYVDRAGRLQCGTAGGSASLPMPSIHFSVARAGCGSGVAEHLRHELYRFLPETQSLKTFAGGWGMTDKPELTRPYPSQTSGPNTPIPGGARRHILPSSLWRAGGANAVISDDKLKSPPAQTQTVLASGHGRSHSPNQPAGG